MTSKKVTKDAAYEVADALLARMTLREKIGQMTQVEKNSITPEAVTEHAIGSVLSGGGGNPEPNSPSTWRDMVMGFRRAARRSRLGIPLIYGSDAVHGHNNVAGATIFPHNIGLGAVGDPDLVKRIARATVREVVATGVRWTFAPAVSIPLDVRWGRTYEGYAQDPELVSHLAAALVEGLCEGLAEGGRDAPETVLPSVKHYVGDGAARFGTSTRIDRVALATARADRTLANANVDERFITLVERGAWLIDQGDAVANERLLRDVFLPPYRAAIEAGALNVMVSYSSWNGLRMHSHRHLVTDVLKGELDFEGFVVSDWEGMQQVDADYERSVELCINAGVDMIMVPFDYGRYIDALEAHVLAGAVSQERIDDATRRILYVKARLGLFEQSEDDDSLPSLALVGHADHRRIAHEAARRSLVLLQNRREVLPLAPGLPKLLVAGIGADDVGTQCGGWTVTWMGGRGQITRGTTLLEGLRQALPGTEVVHDPDGTSGGSAPVGIAVVSEEPYAEGMGDRSDLSLSVADRALVENLRGRVASLIVVVYSGRPVALGDVVEQADAIVAAWLPGSEGAAVAEPIVGLAPFEGTLRFRWPAAIADLPLHPFPEAEDGGHARAAQFDVGHGLRTRPPA